MVWGKGYDCFQYSIDDVAKDFDAIFVLENYGADWLPDLSRISKPKFLWIIDSHKVAAEINSYSIKNKIDFNLVAWKNHLKLFNNSIWFPPCFPVDLCKPYSYIRKEYNIGFCGSRGNRGDWLDWLTEDVGLKQDIFVLGDKMIRNINSYKIHFNRNETEDVLAFRTFETLGCGTFLLTDASGNVTDLFQNGKQLAVYYNYEDCISKICYYLSHQGERERIAAAGYEEARLKHTYDFRARAIIAILNEKVDKQFDCLGDRV
jgi:hypothetical protein